MCITGSLDEIASYAPPFSIINDWHLPTYNSSVMVLDPDYAPEVWEEFRTYKGTPYGDQHWITQMIPDASVFPEGWCVSYRTHAQTGVPQGAKVVVFHGQPKPHEFPSTWVKDYWRE